MGKKVSWIGGKGKRGHSVSREQVEDLDVRVALIPIGLEAVAEELEREVERLAGPRYGRHGGLAGHYRWGAEERSIYLADQKVRLRVPRVRDYIGNKEVSLRAYELLQSPRGMDEGLLRRILLGISCRDYERCCRLVPEAFGLSPSTISRRFIKASSGRLKELMERDLSEYDIVVLFMDGKSFAEDEMIIALGVTADGKKVPLGFIQAATENEAVVREFLWGLLDRGLRVDEGILCVIDGSKGLRAGIKKVFSDRALIQRCQWHKRENVVGYLPKGMRPSWRRKLQRAYEKPTYDSAKAALMRLKSELRLVNESAAASLEEGLEETLTLHRLGVFEKLGISLKTTNCLESLMALVEDYTGKVDRWRNSSQKHRWLATALLEIEPRLRRIKGHRHLPTLRQAIQCHLNLNTEAA
jgi:transposase-like protein